MLSSSLQVRTHMYTYTQTHNKNSEGKERHHRKVPLSSRELSSWMVTFWIASRNGPRMQWGFPEGQAKRMERRPLTHRLLLQRIFCFVFCCSQLRNTTAYGSCFISQPRITYVATRPKKKKEKKKKQVSLNIVWPTTLWSLFSSLRTLLLFFSFLQL